MSQNNPWKTVGSRAIYKNPWITVREDLVVRPDGQPGIYGVVETKIACGVVALSPKNEVYLIGQYRYPTECYSWEIVEGGAEHGEDPLAAIQRELREEAGLAAARWETLGGKIHLSNCISNEIAMLWVARDLTETQQSPDGTEVLAVRKEPLDVCVEMVRRGEITDAMSIIGILRIEQLVREGAA